MVAKRFANIETVRPVSIVQWALQLLLSGSMNVLGMVKQELILCGDTVSVERAVHERCTAAPVGARRPVDPIVLLH